MFELKPEAYLINGDDLDPEFEGTCIIGVMPLPDVLENESLFLFGDVFLRHFYSVYDFD